MHGKRYKGSAGKARRVHRMKQVSSRATWDAIEDYYDPEDPPAPRRSFVPIHRGARSLASFNDAQRETVSTEQLELPFPAKTSPSLEVSAPGVTGEQIDSGWTLIEPKGSDKADRQHHDRPVAPTKAPVPVIRAPRTISVPATPTVESTFSLQRFFMGCAAGLATAAMILITIRFAVG